MIIPHQQAKDMLVVDPHTGLQIEHVAATDPDKGWIEVWATYPCAEGHKSVWIEEGKTVERDYMLLQFTIQGRGHTYQTRILHIDYDIVNKHTGLVLYEVRLASGMEDLISQAPGPEQEEGEEGHNSASGER